MKRPEGGWGKTGDQVKAAYAREYKKVNNEMSKYVRAAALRGTGEYVTAQHCVDRIIGHVVARNLAKKYGWDYSKQKVN